MGRFHDFLLPARLDQSYQGSQLKLANSWYGLGLSFALMSHCRAVLAGLKASYVQPAGRKINPKGATEEMNKKDVVNKSMMAAAGILVAASMAFAKSPSPDLGRSSRKSAEVDIYQTARIPGGPTLQSGEYRVVLNNNSPTPELGFYQNGKLVAQVPAKLVEQGKKIDETEILYQAEGDNSQVLTEMDLQGWKEKVLFGQNDGNAGSGN